MFFSLFLVFALGIIGGLIFEKIRIHFLSDKPMINEEMESIDYYNAHITIMYNIKLSSKFKTLKDSLLDISIRTKSLVISFQFYHSFAF